MIIPAYATSTMRPRSVCLPFGEGPSTSRTFSVYYPDTRPGSDRYTVVASLNGHYEDWQAMERARPVIASAVGGLSEIVVDGETGIVVPAADADALAEAIVALASDLPRAAAMGQAGRERALTQFTPERCVERIEKLYARALASG